MPPGLAVRPDLPEIPDSSTLDQRAIGEFIIRQDEALRMCIGSLDSVLAWDERVRAEWKAKSEAGDGSSDRP